MTQAVMGLLTGFAGLVAAGYGLLAQAAGSDPAGWVQVGGIGTAVGALAYVAKLLADGRLVAQPIASVLEASDAREQRLASLIEMSMERESAFRSMLIQRQAGTHE